MYHYQIMDICIRLRHVVGFGVLDARSMFSISHHPSNIQQTRPLLRHVLHHGYHSSRYIGDIHCKCFSLKWCIRLTLWRVFEDFWLLARDSTHYTPFGQSVGHSVHWFIHSLVTLSFFLFILYFYFFCFCVVSFFVFVVFFWFLVFGFLRSCAFWPHCS